MTDAADLPQPKREKKKKDKVRSAWIAFAGRILAHVIGAASTVVFALMFLHGYSSSSAPTPDADQPPSTRAPRMASDRSLAVLPFENYTGDPEQEHLADGMTEALVADLAQLEGLQVISRTSSMAYKGERLSLPHIVDNLGVKWIVEGSVATRGDRVRITVQLIDGGNDQHVWARSYEQPRGDALPADLTAGIAREIDTLIGRNLAAGS